MKEYTIPIFSLIKGHKIKTALQAMLQEATIENLWMPYFCVATNLTNGEKTLHTRGPLLEALLSSFAIPGVLPPVLKKGHILVDGAFLDNLPIHPMQQKGPGRLIALNVSPVEDPSIHTSCEHFPDPGPTFFQKLNPFSKKKIPPGIVSILMRATTISSVHQLERLRREVDLFIEPPIAQFGLMEWEKIDQIIEAGYLETLHQLQKESGLFCLKKI